MPMIVWNVKVIQELVFVSDTIVGNVIYVSVANRAEGQAKYSLPPGRVFAVVESEVEAEFEAKGEGSTKYPKYN